MEIALKSRSSRCGNPLQSLSNLTQIVIKTLLLRHTVIARGCSGFGGRGFGSLWLTFTAKQRPTASIEQTTRAGFLDGIG